MEAFSWHGILTLYCQDLQVSEMVFQCLGDSRPISGNVQELYQGVCYDRSPEIHGPFVNAPVNEIYRLL